MNNRVLISNSSHRYFILSGTTFIVATLIGFLASVKIALPENIVSDFNMLTLRPLHTFLSLVAVIAGLTGLIHFLIKLQTGKLLQQLQWIGFMIFLIVGSISIISGNAVGREYFSWSVWNSIPLVFSLFILLWQLFSSQESLTQKSPEAFWLVGMGCLFIFNGLIESQLSQLTQLLNGELFSNYITDLSIQWHGIDTFFAGINTALYGGAAFLLNSKPKPLRKPVLFIIAGFSLLFTFGHHHYISPQPNFLKHLAFIASILAMMSFWRHVQVYKKMNPDNFTHGYTFPIWKAIELWTIVSIVSGVVFAIPQINLLVHGTYMVVIHAMGSMIGINFMIILLGGLTVAINPSAINSKNIERGVKLVNFSLIGLWINLSLSGLTKGILRINHDYEYFQPFREWILLFFPVLGLVLLCGILYLCYQMVNLQFRTMQNNPELLKNSTV